MTLEEAIEELERLLLHWDELENGKRSFRWYSKDAVEVALSALRPVSREQVEQVWGEWTGNIHHSERARPCDPQQKVHMFCLRKSKRESENKLLPSLRGLPNGRGRADGSGEIGGAA